MDLFLVAVPFLAAVHGAADVLAVVAVDRDGELWIVGSLDCWNLGTLDYWIVGMLDHWKVGVFEIIS